MAPYSVLTHQTSLCTQSYQTKRKRRKTEKIEREKKKWASKWRLRERVGKTDTKTHQCFLSQNARSVRSTRGTITVKMIQPTEQ